MQHFVKNSDDYQILVTGSDGNEESQSASATQVGWNHQPPSKTGVTAETRARWELLRTLAGIDRTESKPEAAATSTEVSGPSTNHYNMLRRNRSYRKRRAIASQSTGGSLRPLVLPRMVNDRNNSIGSDIVNDEVQSEDFIVPKQQVVAQHTRSAPDHYPPPSPKERPPFRLSEQDNSSDGQQPEFHNDSVLYSQSLAPQASSAHDIAAMTSHTPSGSFVPQSLQVPNSIAPEGELTRTDLAKSSGNLSPYAKYSPWRNSEGTATPNQSSSEVPSGNPFLTSAPGSVPPPPIIATSRSPVPSSTASPNPSNVSTPTTINLGSPKLQHGMEMKGTKISGATAGSNPLPIPENLSQISSSTSTPTYSDYSDLLSRSPEEILMLLVEGKIPKEFLISEEGSEWLMNVFLYGLLLMGNSWVEKSILCEQMKGLLA